MSYLRDVQPVVTAHCAGCHAHDRQKNKVILSEDLTDQFSIAYEELLPYLTVATANRWDQPDDVWPRPPYTYGSKVSPLAKILAAGHHEVPLTRDERERLLTWINCNGVYYDRYETAAYADRRIFTGEPLAAMEKVFVRRCGNCHASDGRRGTWWLSLNRGEVQQSRMLAAPLAASAGGWGRCGARVFADTKDPDYQALLTQLTALRNRLRERPREDLASVRRGK